MSNYPFPVLSLFSIYTNNPTESPSTSSTLEDDDQEIHLSDSELELKKILFYHSTTSNSDTKERKARLMGTVMGMADFARMLIPGEAPTVKSVHSSKQRMIWIEPEKGYFIHATIEFPKVSKHIKDGSSSSMSDKNSPNYLEDEPLLVALKNGYSIYRLKYGSFEGLLTREGRENLIKSIDSFWGEWLKKWSLQEVNRSGFESVVGGFSAYKLKESARLQMNPLLSQFIVSNPSSIPIIFHYSDILYLPSLPTLSSSSTIETLSSQLLSPPLTEQDCITLIEQLLLNLPPSPSLQIPLKKKSSKSNTHSSTPSTSSIQEKNKSESKWNTYTLGMGSYLISPSVPTLPTLPTIRNMTSMANLPSLSMGSMSLPSLSIPSMSMSGSKKEGIVKSTISEPIIISDPITTSSTIVSETSAEQSTSKTSSIVDSDALADAVNVEEFTNALIIDKVEEVKVVVQKLEEVSKFYCGEGDMKDTKIEVRLYKRGVLTLALVTRTLETSDLIDNKAARLLEAVESIIDTSTSTQSSNPHRHLIKTNSFVTFGNWPSKDEEWSGKNNGEGGGTGEEINGTLFDNYRNFESEPPILESFIRLISKQWIFTSRSSSINENFPVHTTGNIEKQDVFAVLPSRIGKEGSFIDASEEIRKLLEGNRLERD